MGLKVWESRDDNDRVGGPMEWALSTRRIQGLGFNHPVVVVEWTGISMTL